MWRPWKTSDNAAGFNTIEKNYFYLVKALLGPLVNAIAAPEGECHRMLCYLLMSACRLRCLRLVLPTLGRH